MKKSFRFAGFTLLELIIVIIILGILAILGFTQYGRVVERSRGAEARSILGDIRKLANAFVLENGIAGALNNAAVNIGINNDQIPSACRISHFFSYNVAYANPVATITATRCTVGGLTPGKPPDRAAGAWTLILTSNLATGQDGWAGTGGY